jgi:hypothetical protein
MKTIQLTGLSFIATILTATALTASPIVIAGSKLSAPPSFWPDSFWGITQSIDRAFPFEIALDTSSRVEQLQIAAFRYQNLGGSSAEFTIHLDASGVPGSQLATFHFSGIPTSPGILSSPPTADTILHPGTPYWIVGSTPRGQVNWNLADSVFGRIAYRVAGNDWIINEQRNLSAFAIIGSPVVPEPSGAILCVVTGLCMALRFPRRQGSVGLHASPLTARISLSRLRMSRKRPGEVRCCRFWRADHPIWRSRIRRLHTGRNHQAVPSSTLLASSAVSYRLNSLSGASDIPQ